VLKEGGGLVWEEGWGVGGQRREEEEEEEDPLGHSLT